MCTNVIRSLDFSGAALRTRCRSRCPEPTRSRNHARKWTTEALWGSWAPRKLAASVKELDPTWHHGLSVSRWVVAQGQAGSGASADIGLNVPPHQIETILHSTPHRAPAIGVWKSPGVSPAYPLRSNVPVAQHWLVHPSSSSVLRPPSCRQFYLGDAKLSIHILMQQSIIDTYCQK